MKIALTAFTAALVLAATPAFAQGGLDRILAADANGDGSITRAEARTARDAMFTRADANRDGFVTAEEMQATRGHAKKGRGGRQGADTNGDGKVSREEFVNGPMQGFDRIDANSNDVLEPSEIEVVRNFMGRRGARQPS